jgi:hypothetical protein
MSDRGTTDEAPIDGDETLEELLASNKLEAAVEAGRITYQQADELLQQAEHRRAAEEGPTLDTDAAGRITQGGFGSGNRGGKQAGSGR